MQYQDVSTFGFSQGLSLADSCLLTVFTWPFLHSHESLLSPVLFLVKIAVSFNLNYLLRGPTFNYRNILRYWKLGLLNMNFEGHHLFHNTYDLTMYAWEGCK